MDARLALWNFGAGAVGGAYKNDKRLEVYDYSAPIYQEKLVLFVNVERPFAFNQIDDLAGKTVGVNRGWSYGQKFDQAREAQLFDVNVRTEPSENFKMLALGRIDCLILDKLSGESYVNLLELGNKIVAHPFPFSMNDSYLIISKHLNMRAFLSEFDASLERIRESGRYQEIEESFIKDALPSE